MTFRVSRYAKFRNVPTTVDGRTFHSKKEARRYLELKAMQHEGLIDALECQPRYRLEVNATHICDYLADFKYVQDGIEVVEDVKGVRTREYELKKRLMRACHGIEVEEIR